MSSLSDLRNIVRELANVVETLCENEDEVVDVTGTTIPDKYKLLIVELNGLGAVDWKIEYTLNESWEKMKLTDSLHNSIEFDLDGDVLVEGQNSFATFTHKEWDVLNKIIQTMMGEN